jgi:hypothetical protein
MLYIPDLIPRGRIAGSRSHPANQDTRELGKGTCTCISNNNMHNGAIKNLIIETSSEDV